MNFIAIGFFIITAIPILAVTEMKVRQIVKFQSFLNRAMFRVNQSGHINIVESYANLIRLPFWSTDFLACVVWENAPS